MLTEFIIELESIAKDPTALELKERLNGCIDSLNRILTAYEEQNIDRGQEEIERFIHSFEEWPEINKYPVIKDLFTQYMPRVETYPNWLHNTTVIPAHLPAELVAYLGYFCPDQSLLRLSLSCTFFKNGLEMEVNKRKVVAADKIIYISTGSDCTFFVQADGTVWGCGRNNAGQLGLGHRENRYTPTQLPNLYNAKQVVTGFSHTLFLKEDGTVWGCGRNNVGQLGLGLRENQYTPTRLRNLSNVKQVIAGAGGHTLFFKEDGTVWGCGNNSYGQLGLSHRKQQVIPTQLPDLFDIKQVVAGAGGHTLFLKKDGTVWGCGDNSYGQLGSENIANQHNPIQLPDLFDIKQVIAGADHSLFLKEDGTVWGCGNNNSGQLGLGYKETQVTPTQLPDLFDIKQVAASFSYTLFLKEDGTVWGCGNNNSGQLGLGRKKVQVTPIQLPNLSDISQIIAGIDHTLFLKEDSTVWGCGNGDFGKLGSVMSGKNYSPIKLELALNGKRISSPERIEATRLPQAENGKQEDSPKLLCLMM
jgi:alpha-tubulin suppressor-like RCC1 family protein